MFIATNRCRGEHRRERRGIVLLVVIAMLALFAAVGLAFVYYAQAEADNANMSAQTQSQNNVDIDADFLTSWALGQLIYGVEDQLQYGIASNVNSSLRGHDLARGIFGYNRYSLNVTPFNGVGRPSAIDDPDVKDGATPIKVDQLLNYRFFKGDGNLFGTGTDFIRDPDRYGTTNRNAKSDPPNTPPQVDLLKVNNPYYGPNVPYTIATGTDLSSVYLGKLNSDGSIAVQSFWRNTLNGQNFSLDPTDPTNNLWVPYTETTAAKIPPPWKKYASLRPLPYYNPNFPPPQDKGGDVRNVPFGTGIAGARNDSIWIDLGFPVRTAPDGRRYKPLFAFFIADLDGKVNINASGNVRMYDGTNYDHASHRGYSTFEINLAKVLNSTTDTKEWQRILAYRYGSDGKPGTAGTSWATGAGSASPIWGYVDFDSVKNDPANKNDANNKYYVSETLNLPGAWPMAVDPNQGKTSAFPYLSRDTFQNGTNTGNSTTAGTSELYEHPWLYNAWIPSGDDRRFHIASFEPLWRYGDGGSPSMSSELFSLLPKNLLDNAGDSTKSRWRMLTPHSVDFARPGISPWLTSETAEKFELAAADLLPKGAFAAYPKNLGTGPNTLAPQSPNNSEFGADFRGYSDKTSSIRFNLAQPVFDTSTSSWRSLTAYPNVDGTGKIDTTDANLQKAINDRTQFAQNLFDRMRFVTTGARPSTPINKLTLSPAEYDALRWLAQLAVNMVDYIDTDDIATTFVWDTNNPYFTDMAANPADGFVVGTELPRVAINEIYAEIVNDVNDNGVINMLPPEKNFKVNFWVELINPLRKDPAGASPDPYTVRLQVATTTTQKGWPVYKLTILDKNDDATLGRQTRTSMTGAAMLGDPDPAKIKLEVADFDKTGMTQVDVTEFFIQPLDVGPVAPWPANDGKNEGLYLMGPQIDLPSKTGSMAKVPTATTKINPKKIGSYDSAMSYELDKATDFADMTKHPVPHTILLRRLANPGLDYQNDPTKALYNPYVTVDYVEDVDVMQNDGIEYDKDGAHTKPAVPKKAEERKAVGRKQPYAGYKNQWQPQAQTATMDQPWHSFFAHNSTLQQPAFDWLVHLDRNVTSPIELLNVSMFRPHELTQRFVDVNGKSHMHMREWDGTNYYNPRTAGASTSANRSEHRLWRLFEYLDAGWRTTGVNQHGRVPGKININSVEKEAFRALCAHHTSIFSFPETDIDTIFDRIKATRDQTPFKSIAAPNLTATTGIQDTIFRDGATAGTPLFQAGSGSHPTEQIALLDKIFNNMTTRSNVFAVWLTVGFFEVNTEDTNGNGVLDAGEDLGGIYKNGILDTELLGKEIGREDNRHVRHRMFAIVDRTALLLPETPAKLLAPITTTGAQTVQIKRVTLMSPNRVEFQLQPGMQMEVDTVASGNQETVTITAVNYSTFPATITANFQKPHAADTFISVPEATRISGPSVQCTIDFEGQKTANTVHGNPGPQFRFDHRHNNLLVPHYSIIQ